MAEYTPTPAPQFLTNAYWPAYNRVELESAAQGIDQLDAEAEAFFAGLRAVEAAVRADQIEKDAAIAEDAPGSDATGYYAGESHSGYGEAQRHIAAAIRAQLTEGSDHG